MNSKILFSILLGFGLFSCSYKPGQCPNPTMKVYGRFLYDACGEKVILRGVNEMFIWSDNDKVGEKTFPEIRKTGANVVRIVWTVEGSADQLDSVITNCIKSQMIPMPELHDATGNLDKVAEVVDYWVSPEVVRVINKHQKYLLLNIANEAGVFDVQEEEFMNTYIDAINRIREANIHVPLIIDPSDWGKNIDMVQATGAYLTSQDPDKNLLFSTHIWWADEDGSTNKIISELQESVDIQLPLIIGEFAPMAGGCRKYIDYHTILRECNKHEIGWLAWSWGQAKNGDCSDMDMTVDGTFGNWTNAENFGYWGKEVCITDSFSIKNTAVTPYSISIAGKNIK